MTNLKTKGFDSPAQLREYLDDVEESDHTTGHANVDGDEDARLKEVAWLRKEVSDLRLQLGAIYGREEVSRPVVEKAEPWVKIVGSVALAYGLYRIVQRFS